MPPVPAAVRRLPAFACVGMAAAALTLSACGGDGAAATAEQAATDPGRAAVQRTPAAACPSEVHAFVRSLDSLRRQLAVGLSYEQYAARVDGLGERYGQIPVERLTLQCLARQGTAAEQALNRYIDGVNAWGECLADAACTAATIEPVLQRKWRGASGFVSEAQ